MIRIDTFRNGGFSVSEASYKCEKCGGELEIRQGSSVGVCRVCGSTRKLPAAESRPGSGYKLPSLSFPKERAHHVGGGRSAKEHRRRILWMLLVLVVIALGVTLYRNVIEPNVRLNRAQALIAAGRYDDGYALLEELGRSDEVAKNRYERAEAGIAAGDYAAAYPLLKGLKYADAQERAEEIRPLYVEALLRSAQAGDIVVLGTYEQDGREKNGAEDIEWLVLAEEDGRLLAVSRFALDCLPYNTEYVDVTWAESTLRVWLNGEFTDTAFAPEDLERIPAVTVAAGGNPGYSVRYGSAAEDRVFLLSLAEAEEHFDSDEARKCVPTAYAAARGANAITADRTADGSNACDWWLRSPGYAQNIGSLVWATGHVDSFGYLVDHKEVGVRPALWIERPAA